MYKQAKHGPLTLNQAKTSSSMPGTLSSLFTDRQHSDLCVSVLSHSSYSIELQKWKFCFILVTPKTFTTSIMVHFIITF